MTKKSDWSAFVNQAKRGFPIVDEYVTRGAMAVPGALSGLLIGANEADRTHGWKSFSDWGRFKDSVKTIGRGVVEGAKAGWREAPYADAVLERGLSNVANEFLPGMVDIASKDAGNAVRKLQDKTPLKSWRDYAEGRVEAEKPAMLSRTFGPGPLSKDEMDLVSTGDAISGYSEIPLHMAAGIKGFDAALGGAGKLLRMANGATAPAKAVGAAGTLGRIGGYARKAAPYGLQAWASRDIPISMYENLAPWSQTNRTIGKLRSLAELARQSEDARQRAEVVPLTDEERARRYKEYEDIMQRMY